MDITNRYKIQEFIDKHPEAEKMFNKWINDILIANWRNHAELKQMYASADYVGNNRYVFNIRITVFVSIHLNHLVSIS